MKNEAVFFTFAVFIAIAAGVFKDINNRERHHFRFELKPDTEITQTIDIAKQGWLKKKFSRSLFLL